MGVQLVLIVEFTVPLPPELTSPFLSWNFPECSFASLSLLNKELCHRIHDEPKAMEKEITLQDRTIFK